MTVIPAIDLRAGRCVRLLQGDFDRETVYRGDPVEAARAYRESGFDRLHVVDLDGARSGTQQHQAIIAEIVADTGLDVQLGGGLRDRDAVDRWLQAGVARCVVGSLAVSMPDTVAEWLDAFGRESIVLALDVRTEGQQDPRLSTHGWARATATSLWQAMDFYAHAGVRHVLCTDVARDGMMTGPNVALYGGFLARYPDVALQASGGIRDLRDLEALRDVGCAAAITGRALLDTALTPAEVMTFLRDA